MPLVTWPVDKDQRVDNYLLNGVVAFWHRQDAIGFGPLGVIVLHALEQLGHVVLQVARLTRIGCDVEEMPRNKERSFCCGGGGGRMWMEEKIGTRINLNRVDEAISTGVDEVAVACPFCRVMVGDGMVARQSDVEVLDVAQVLLRNLKN